MESTEAIHSREHAVVTENAERASSCNGRGQVRPVLSSHMLNGHGTREPNVHKPKCSNLCVFLE